MLIQNGIGQLYLKLEKCKEAPLALFILPEFSSLKEMDGILAEGRFLSALAQRLASTEDKRIMSMFEMEIDLLHTQAENIGMALKFFYQAALQETEEIYSQAPEKEVSLELE